MARYRFNEQLTPPAAFVFVSIIRPDGGASARDVPAQLDTAADFTVLPTAIVDRLGLKQVSEIPVSGFGGVTAISPTYVVDVQVHDFEPKRVEVVSSDNEQYVLLGRDLLNRFRVVFDGPNQILEIA